jgi:AraC-like DNA-binding protein
MSDVPDTLPDMLDVRRLFESATLAISDVRCGGQCRHRSPAECAGATHLVFPYRGVFVRHVGQVETVAEGNQLVFFNDDQDYAISHPVGGGDACLSIAIDQDHLRELSPKDQLAGGARTTFGQPRRGIDPRAQALVALLRHGLTRGAIEPLEAETLATDPARRWTLGEIGAAIGVSPIYLTQVFAQVEGVPLYRYQLRLRLARALDLLGDYDDLTMLGLDLGFSSHSHFSAAFRQLYGRTPAEFQRAARLR